MLIVSLRQHRRLAPLVVDPGPGRCRKRRPGRTVRRRTVAHGYGCAARKYLGSALTYPCPIRISPGMPERIERVEVHLSPSERAACEAAADGLGLKLAAWLRMIAIMSAKSQEKPIGEVT